MTGFLIGSAIFLPIISGVICSVIKNYKIRAGLVILTAVLLISVSLYFLLKGDFPSVYSPADLPLWDKAVSTAGILVLLIFLTISILDIRKRGFSKHNVLPIVLTLAGGIPLVVFEFAGGYNGESIPTFYIDRLSLLMVLIVSVIGSLICVFAIKYMKDHEAHLAHDGKLQITRQPRFFFFLLAFLGIMNGLVLANNLLWLAFFWELTTLCCWGLISHDGTPLAKTNALRALWMCLIGSSAMNIAIILLSNSAGTSLSLQAITSATLGLTPALALPLAFLFIAAFTKSAQVPFQSWLLGAMVAPTPVSALLHSSTMVNAGVYLLFRLAPSFQGTALSTYLAVYGGMVYLVTSLLAISQNDGKKVLAYSTIANLGLMVLLAGINTPISIACGLILLLIHALTKALLFLSVGTIEHYIWSRDIENMEGLAHRLPVLAGILMTGILSMLAAPFGVILAKWGALETAARGDLWSVLILIMLVLGSAATTVFWVKWVGRLFCHAPTTSPVKREPFIPLYHGVLLLLLICALVSSILILPVYNLLIAPYLAGAGYNIAQAFDTASWSLKSSIGLFAVWPLLIILLIAIFLPLVLVKTKPSQIRPAYMCGENVEVGSDQFRAEADQKTDLKTGGFYIANIFPEGSFTRYLIPIGVIFLAVLIGLVVL